jgi:hypothetical protein
MLINKVVRLIYINLCIIFQKNFFLVILFQISFYLIFWLHNFIIIYRRESELNSVIYNFYKNQSNNKE